MVIMAKRPSTVGNRGSRVKSGKAQRPDHAAEIDQLRAELAYARETLRAIQSGDVDAVVVSGPEGERLFTLKGAEYAYRSLVEAMNEGAATLSRDGLVLYCNKQLPLFVKLTQEKVIGHPIRSLIAASHGATFNALFERALAGESGKAEVQLQGSDGTLAPAYVSLSSVEVDEAPAVCMVVTDLTEHKKTDELIAAGSLARSILKHAVEAIAVCDREGRIILANEALQSLYGGSPLFQLIGDVLPLRSADHPGDQPFSAVQILSGNFRVQEAILERAGSPVSWLLLTAGPMTNGTEVVGFVVTLLDITERKMAEHALLRSEKLAATGRMAATIAHEINNPLTAVMNAVYIASMDAAITDEGKSALSLASMELERVASITRQTLGFYRENATPALVDCRQVLDEVLALFGARLKNKEVSVEKRYCDGSKVIAVQGELRQVFSNLLANAYDAVSSQGRIKCCIRTSPFTSDETVRVTIADNGAGIVASHMKRIFEPFFTTKENVGTGLGLWVCKELTEKQGGSISIRSRPGVGTVVSVTLPAAK
jgi:PAS domain S-box-containing protein